MISKPKVKTAGMIIAGFGMIFSGLYIMSAAMNTVSEMEQIRNLFVVIDSCVLNQLEKNRQRHVEKNILEIPKVKLRMTEEVSMEKRKTVQITVGAEKRTDG